MSIPQGLLALLRPAPMYGYQLRAAFEQATGGTWPLNIGQVYSTLTRLERDGLVTALGADDDGRVRYEITASGRESATDWYRQPVTLGDRPRDELAIKLALAAGDPGADVRAVVQTQRTATMQRLQQLTRLKPAEPTGADLGWTLVLDNLRYMAEAELRWLDHCEGALTRSRAQAATAAREAVADAADADHVGDRRGVEGARR